MLEFAVTGERNKLIELQKFFRDLKYKLTQSFGADLKYDAAAAADETKLDAPYFCKIVWRSLLSDCKRSVNGLKMSNANGNDALKSFVETEFLHSKDAKNKWLTCQVYLQGENPVDLSTAEVNRSNILVRGSGK